jgi:hypothetical protein
LQDFVNFKKEMAKESAKRRESTLINEGKFVLNIDFIIALKPDGLCVYETTKQDSISFYYIEFF